MITYVRNFFASHFSEGHDRTIKAKKNIAALFVLRGVSFAVSFLLVPLTLSYLNPSRYGIWLTLSSLITWVNVLDIGLGNGLRNKFAEALARKETETARIYVSTTYFFVAIMTAAAIVLFMLINPFLNWPSILNSSASMEHELTVLAVVVFVFFCLRLLFGLIATLLIADQKPAVATGLEAITNVASLVAVYILTRTTDSSLLWLGIIMSFFIAFIPFGANLWFFAREYKPFAPSFHWVRIGYTKELVGLGIKFFLLQLAGIAIFSSSNIIIAQYYGPAEVTPYNIAFKYYGIALTGFTMILTPFWSAYTDAFTRADIGWITRSNKKLVRIWIYFAAGVLLMTILADKVYALWIGDAIHVQWSLSVWMGIYILLIAWCNIFAYFMNGTGKIRLQLWAATMMSIVSVTLGIFFSKHMGYGATGVVAATCIAISPGCILWPIQMRKLLSGKAFGIWNK